MPSTAHLPFVLGLLPNGWHVGRFGGLEAIVGLRHAVTTRRGPDVELARDDRPDAAARCAAALGLAEAGADVVGSNCGQGIEGFVPLARRLCAATDRPVWIKANAGLPVLEAGRTVYRTTPQEFARHVPALADAGVSFVGGCCGTTPEFIEHVRAALDR